MAIFKVVTCNVNGLRAAERKGFFSWITALSPDVVCVQETKAQCHQLEGPAFRPQGYHAYFVEAEKKGYSGVGIYTRCVPEHIEYTSGLAWSDLEGRFIQVTLPQAVVTSLYAPSGTSGAHRQDKKYEWMAHYRAQVAAIEQSDRPHIFCGDFNIAHQEIDLKNWKQNRKHSGFLPEERAWMSELLETTSLCDVYRCLYPENPGYTWWSQRGQARKNNVGWRIDYQLVSQSLYTCVQRAYVYTDVHFSDHAPLVVEYAI